MAKINLLPQEFKVVQNVNVSGLVIKAAAFLLVAVMVFFYSAFITDYREQKKQLEVVQNKLDKYYPTMANLNILNKTKQDLAQLSAILQGLESNRVIWSRCLTFIKDAPEGVLVGEITTGEGNSFTLKGQTSGFSLVGIYYLNLKDCPDLVDFSIQIVREDLSPEGIPVITYVLQGHLKGGVK